MRVCDTFDVVIVGGGPAGIAAALWCDELGLSSCVVEKGEALGGQLSWIHNPIRNYPGVEFATGAECLQKFEASLSQRSFERFANTEVVALDVTARSVVTSVGLFAGNAIVVASGVRRRELKVPGELEFQGRGILASGSRDRHEAAGQTVAVVGGGDAALENALVLSEHADRVYLVHRRSEFSAREEFIEGIAARSNIETILDAEVTRFGGEQELEYVDIRNADGPRRLAVSRAIVRIGVVPNSEFLGAQIELDAHGYVTVDHLGQTSAAGVYAIGDISNPAAPTIATAGGSAAIAVKAIAKYLRELE